jgi:hypothetical protein
MDNSMADDKTKRLNRDDWIRGALELLSATGVEGVGIVPNFHQII